MRIDELLKIDPRAPLKFRVKPRGDGDEDWIYHEGNIAVITKFAYDDDEEEEGGGDVYVEVDLGGGPIRHTVENAVKWLKVALSAVTQFVELNQPDAIYFSSPNLSRTKTYDRMIKRYMPKNYVLTGASGSKNAKSYIISRKDSGLQETKLDEVLDMNSVEDLPFDIEKDYGYYAYTYRNKRMKVEVQFDRPSPSGAWEVVAEDYNARREFTAKYAIEFFKIVLSAIKHFIKTVKPDRISFTTTDSGHTKLYDRMLQRYLPQYFKKYLLSKATGDKYSKDYALKRVQKKAPKIQANKLREEGNDESSELRLKDLATVKTNMEDADFWLIPTHDYDKVGQPVREFKKHYIGIKVTRPDVIDPKYLYHVLLNVYNQGYWHGRGTGVTARQTIKVSDVANIRFG